MDSIDGAIAQKIVNFLDNEVGMNETYALVFTHNGEAGILSNLERAQDVRTLLLAGGMHMATQTDEDAVELVSTPTRTEDDD